VALDAAGQRDLLARRQQVHLGDLSQIEAHRVEIRTLNREVECRAPRFIVAVALERLVALDELDAPLD
jgi:hypothetical protein